MLADDEFVADAILPGGLASLETAAFLLVFFFGNLFAAEAAEIIRLTTKKRLNLDVINAHFLRISSIVIELSAKNCP